MNGTVPAEISRSGPARHFTLLDPDRQSPEAAGAMASMARAMGSDVILIGGSTAGGGATERTAAAVKAACSAPTILFVNGAACLTRHADHVFWMMLMNSKSRRFLIGEQVEAAPHVRALGLNPIGTGYIVISTSATPTTVERVGAVDPILPDGIDAAVRYALTAQYFGMKCVFLDAGSGADRPVPVDMVRAVRDALDIPLIVAGGIRDDAAAAQAVVAGADAVVTGTVIERTPEKLGGIVAAIKGARR
ncbi:geranylgeranylglyceryl/heptaprenylglyceryl phosphate synthase [Sorangium sp. So ce131]|uniref:geranylgeranylglyceryl/heptaprenylglyceryl phosphate synthase n=1 Tax=Sorangium sp. So ce131 TaxID=3133282 RepID=UPI003F5D94F3